MALGLLAKGPSAWGREDGFHAEGGSLLLSRIAMSNTGKRLWKDYLDLCRYDLSKCDVCHLIMDGNAGRNRLGKLREPVLAARGITSKGYRVLLEFMASSKENLGSCLLSGRWQIQPRRTASGWLQ